MSETRHYVLGSDEGGENWACLASLIETCKLNGVNPQAYFTDLLTRLVNGWPQNGINEIYAMALGDKTTTLSIKSKGWRLNAYPKAQTRRSAFAQLLPLAA